MYFYLFSTLEFKKFILTNVRIDFYLYHYNFFYVKLRLILNLTEFPAARGHQDKSSSAVHRGQCQGDLEERDSLLDPELHSEHASRHFHQRNSEKTSRSHRSRRLWKSKSKCEIRSDSYSRDRK